MTSPSESWSPGTAVVLQELWGPHLLVARPVTVVVDDGELLGLYSHPHARIRTAALGTARYQLALEARVDAMVVTEPPVHEERTASAAHVLTLVPRDAWHAVQVFWRPGWEHVCWYVNVQRPMRRLAGRVQYHDCALDLVVRPDRSCEEKDRDELEALASRGFFGPADLRCIEAEARRMREAIARWEAPFCDGWELWRPDPGWASPTLPADWAEGVPAGA